MELVLYRVEDAVARITLNRPEKRNALNHEMILGLDAALQQAGTEADARVILITANGKDFCSGLDLLALDHGNDATVMDHLASARRLANMILTMRRHKLPVISAVQGRALGGGAGIATASDLIIASETSAIGYPEINIGFVPAIVAALLRRSVPEKRLFEILAMGETLPAAKAHALGIVNRVLPDSDFETGASAYARELASRPASALTLLKSLLYQTDAMTFEKALENGVQLNALSRMTDEARAGFANFSRKKT